ncbi:DUF4870 family protein [Pararhodospirillum oryzae]|uniref:Transmembrane protein n=1 Tax=Pararhodospirillum oryzae TaxID=478448 RepID=A0A512HBL6_9PROT|nr:hypothetical protein [Pararhodospirillum oryzae]GEO82790.1 hypothetical protein ROR02_29210 [Pararhodospirillum oryzae]
MNDQPATETKTAPAAKRRAKAAATKAPATKAPAPAPEAAASPAPAPEAAPAEAAAPAPEAAPAPAPAPAPVAAPAPAPEPALPMNDAQKRRLMLIIYALYGASVFTFGVSAIAAYVLYIRKKRDVFAGTIWESHVTWLDRTFLFSAGAAVVGVVLSFAVGGLIVVLALAYLMYRTVKGFLAYDETKAIDTPNAYY